MGAWLPTLQALNTAAKPRPHEGALRGVEPTFGGAHRCTPTSTCQARLNGAAAMRWSMP